MISVNKEYARDREDVLVSVHEAAHAVACFESGVAARGAEIELIQRGLFGKLAGCGVTWHDEFPYAKRFREAVVCYAGAQAEAFIVNRIEGVNYNSALRVAEESGAQSDYAYAWSLYPEDTLWQTMIKTIQLRRAMQVARGLVADNWPEIDVIATHLRAEREVEFRPHSRRA